MQQLGVMQVHDTLWVCEKWSEEAVEFGRKKAERHGLTHLPATVLERVGLIPVKHGLSSAALRALVGPPEEAVEIAGNLLLNEGIQRLQDMTMIATVLSNQVAGNPWSNANAFIGVGDSSTAEAATQTDLQAATNKFYKAMNATFPSRSSQTASFQSDFITTEANFVWAEWTVSAGATSASGGGFTVGTTNLNRKVAALGTKSSGTWTLTSQITIS
jgi:hypothetical protein